jgi:hypothetical protein
MSMGSAPRLTAISIELKQTLKINDVWSFMLRIFYCGRAADGFLPVVVDEATSPARNGLVASCTTGKFSSAARLTLQI